MKEEKNRKVRHLGSKVNLIVVCLLAVSIFLVVRLCVAMFTSLAMDMLHDRCVNGTNMLAYELDDYQGPEDKTEMLDELKTEQLTEEELEKQELLKEELTEKESVQTVRPDH